MGDIEELAASYERKLIEVIAVFVSFIILCEVHSSAFQIFVFPKAQWGIEHFMKVWKGLGIHPES